ncbi:MAG: hypothetical protein AB2804_04730 [Candidatus Thiodiazotropha endolucinida]
MNANKRKYRRFTAGAWELEEHWVEFFHLTFSWGAIAMPEVAFMR